MWCREFKFKVRSLNFNGQHFYFITSYFVADFLMPINKKIRCFSCTLGIGLKIKSAVPRRARKEPIEKKVLKNHWNIEESIANLSTSTPDGYNYTSDIIKTKQTKNDFYEIRNVQLNLAQRLFFKRLRSRFCWRYHFRL